MNCIVWVHCTLHNFYFTFISGRAEGRFWMVLWSITSVSTWKCVCVCEHLLLHYWIHAHFNLATLKRCVSIFLPLRVLKRANKNILNVRRASEREKKRNGETSSVWLKNDFNKWSQYTQLKTPKPDRGSFGTNSWIDDNCVWCTCGERIKHTHTRKKPTIE